MHMAHILNQDKILREHN